MAFRTIHGANLYYELEGTGEDVFVLVHGNVASSRWWDRMWPLLTKTYRVLRVDLRGSGNSEFTGDGNSVYQYSKDIRALLDELQLDSVYLVGHSLGGAVVMDLISQNPGSYKGQILINTSPIEGFVTPEERKPLIQKVMEDRNLMKMAIAAIMPTAAHGEYFEKLVDDAMVAGPTWISNYESLTYADYRAAFADISIPTLLLYGDQDSLIDLDMMKRTQHSIRGSELLVYEGIGHSPNVECPERVVQDIQTFVAK